MEELVVSLETAKKLKAAGFPQGTAWSWYGDKSSSLISTEHLEPDLADGAGFIAAPTAQEIADQLPKAQGQRFLHLAYPINLWIADYTSNIDSSPILSGETGDTIVEALAPLWLKLNEVNHE